MNLNSLRDAFKRLVPTTTPQVDPMDYSAHYNTPIPPDQLAAYNAWIASQKALGKNPENDKYDYDVNGFFLSGAATSPNGHGSDQFKKPNHPTFSNESQYAGSGGNLGGEWLNAGNQSYYNPSPLNLKFRPQGQLQQYFNQVEPDVMLLNPPQRPFVPGLDLREKFKQAR